MTYFAQLLRRSGVVVGEHAATASRDRAARDGSPPPAAGVVDAGDAGDAAQPAIRELHEERVVPSPSLPEKPNLAWSAAPTTAGAGHLDVSGAYARPSHGAGAAAAKPDEWAAPSRAAPSGSEHVEHEARRAPDLHHASDTAGRHRAPDPSAVVAPLASPSAPAALHEFREGRDSAIVDALAEARAWTSLTPLPNEWPPRVEQPLGLTTRADQASRSEAPARAAGHESHAPELRVSIGTIEVVLAEPAAAPAPTRRESTSLPVSGATTASRRLARHHLRG